MRIDRKKYELACARACIGFKDIVEKGIPKGTLCRIIGEAEIRPETIGKLAKILECDVTEIIKD